MSKWADLKEKDIILDGIITHHKIGIISQKTEEFIDISWISLIVDVSPKGDFIGKTSLREERLDKASVERPLELGLLILLKDVQAGLVFDLELADLIGRKDSEIVTREPIETRASRTRKKKSRV